LIEEEEVYPMQKLALLIALALLMFLPGTITGEDFDKIIARSEKEGKPIMVWIPG
jgi:hypothetical protein